jgi:hypothetical protein
MRSSLLKFLGAGAIAAALFTIGCSKSGVNGSSNVPPGKSQLSISMMDAPAAYPKVLVDIKSVAILVDTSTAQMDDDDPRQWNFGWYGRGRTDKDSSLVWDTLTVNPGIYDLVRLRNGVDTLLATGTYPTGKLLKIRIELGPRDTVYTDSVTAHPLEVLGHDGTITINVRREHVQLTASNSFQVWIDFNVNKSIFHIHDQYFLKPWVITFNDHDFAKIQGSVLPEHACALVEAIRNTDTLYTIPNEDGHYKFRAVSAGSWDLTFKGRNGYLDTTVAGIMVDSMKVTKVPDILLHK